MTAISHPAKKDQSHMTIISPPVEEDSSCVTVLSELPSNKFSSHSKLAKMSLYSKLFEDYKLISSRILCELENILKKYAETGMAFPGGLGNLMTYSWQDLIEDFHRSVTPPKLAQDGDLARGFSTMTIFSLKKCQSNPHAMQQSQKENKRKVKKDSKAGSDSLTRKSRKLKLLAVFLKIWEQSNKTVSKWDSGKALA